MTAIGEWGSSTVAATFAGSTRPPRSALHPPCTPDRPQVSGE